LKRNPIKEHKYSGGVIYRSWGGQIFMDQHGNIVSHDEIDEMCECEYLCKGIKIENFRHWMNRIVNRLKELSHKK
jgi:hypothetical protein